MVGSFLRKAWVMAGLAVGLAVAANPARATIVDINSYSPSWTGYGAPVTLSLAAGTYSVSYNTVNPTYVAWNYNTNRTSFIASFSYSINAAPGETPTFRYEGPGNNRPVYTTAAAARDAYAAALTGANFTLATTSNVTFFTPDNGPSDNLGGVSLQVNRAVVPEPATIGLMLVGLVSIGWVIRRRA